MPSFNRVLLLANLTRDPAVKKLPGGTTLCEFGVATNRKFKTQAGEDREEVCFVDCAAFGRTGEVIAQYATKGKPLFLEGRLKYDQWTDQQGGKRSKVSVVVENFQFVGGRDGGQRRDDARQDDGGDPATDQRPAIDDSFPADPTSIPF